MQFWDEKWITLTVEVASTLKYKVTDTGAYFLY